MGRLCSFPRSPIKLVSVEHEIGRLLIQARAGREGRKDGYEFGEQEPLMIWEPLKQVDRRQRSHRFCFIAPASFSWLSPDGEPHQDEGFTRDIGAHGVFIYAYHRPITGTVVEVTVNFPSLDADGPMVKLIGIGTVVRLDPSEKEPSGFAAAVSFAVAATGGTSNFKN